MQRTVSLPHLEQLPITFQQQIPEDYRDAFGHMNVMWYTHLFGYAFGQFGRLFGFSMEYCRAHQVGSFALETHLRYLSEVLVGHRVTVRSRALGRSSKRIHFMHFMTIDESGALAATAEHISAHIDMKVRRMSPMPADICGRFDELAARHEALDWPAPVCGSMKP